MDIVILLGAGEEPAQSVARRLVGLGSRVYGLSNRFPEQGFSHRDFVLAPVNLADPGAVRAEVEKILAGEGSVSAVVLAGHHPVEDALESCHPNDVALAVFAGLAAPLAAVRAALPSLIRTRGLVLALTRPVFGPGAALGGVVEAGVAAFCDGLFSESRDTGLRVCHIRLQENSGPVDPAARHTRAPQSRVQPDIVADAVEAVIRLRENNAITRLVLRPQSTRETPRIPVTTEPKLASLQVVQLPTSSKYPAPEAKIFTPEYRRPDYAPPPDDGVSDEDEDEDESVDPELAYLIKPHHRDRFVRDAAAPSRSEIPDETPGGFAEGGERAESHRAAEESPPQETSPARRDGFDRPQHRREPRQEQNRYHNPYSPEPKQSANGRHGPRHGSVRIQVPVTSGEASRRTESREREALPVRRDKPVRFEQLPRPRDWQGPRYPQGGAAVRPQPSSQPPRDRGPDLHPAYRKAQEAARLAAEVATPSAAPEAQSPVPATLPVRVPASASQPPRRPRIFTDENGLPTGAPPAFSAPVPEKAVVREKIVKAERDEEVDEAPVRLKKRPPAKKTEAKADKALARAEAVAAEPPVAEPLPEKPVKPKRAPKKKAD